MKTLKQHIVQERTEIVEEIRSLSGTLIREIDRSQMEEALCTILRIKEQCDEIESMLNNEIFNEFVDYLESFNKILGHGIEFVYEQGSFVVYGKDFKNFHIEYNVSRNVFVLHEDGKESFYETAEECIWNSLIKVSKNF